jgi:hypothetical protein
VVRPGRATDPAETALLDRLRRRDATASADFAERYLEELVGRLRRSTAGAEDHDLRTVAIDVIMNVIARPEQVDLTRGTLGGYLRMAARRDVQNLQERASRRRSRESSIEIVELPVLERNMFRGITNIDPTAEDAIARADPPAVELDPGVVRDATDEAVLKAMLEGERRTAVYAEILGIASLDPVHQRAEVKRVKDRLKLRLRRTGRP